MSRTTPRPLPGLHVTVVLALVVAFVLALVPVRPADAAPDAELEQQLVQLVNRERSRRGLAPLRIAPELVRVARRHSAEMASQGRLHHNPHLAGQVSDWRKLGENVGRGGRITTIHRAFMDSPAHRRNVLDREWVEVGIAVEVRGDVLWVTQVYRVPLRR